ncbi:NAD(P)/FAD-dependent oxidoreductase [Haloimpatiens lingqiaonensis]|uniref:NAD(P)/FAD-dependent oxidoreductase n=1 Tax=Haloimpatiens lingqiaonensis TaxID=1380675 RepID=UPI0010FEE787|nr:FAD-dependent oxidoreductase [Haloimpatiens lingqiaonensis]
MEKQVINLDLIIVGAGPAGLAAAVYASRSKLDTLVLENKIIGGQVRDSYRVDNYPGFPYITGEDLSNNFQKHALEAGAKIDEFDNIVSMKLGSEEKIVETSKKIYKPHAVILATGSNNRLLPVPEEKKFHGNGVHYCELCDGALYEGKDLIVVGGGNSAIEGAIVLSKFAKNLNIIHQFDYLQANKTNEEELATKTNVKFIWNSEVRHVLGESSVTGVQIENVKTGELSEVKTDGVFVYIGRVANNELFKHYIKLDNWGHVLTNENMETNIKGVYAAGDLRSKTIRQLTTAVSDGTIAALAAEKYIMERKRV